MLLAVLAVVLVACRPIGVKLTPSLPRVPVHHVTLDWNTGGRASFPAEPDPLALGLIPMGRQSIRVPILMYHYIRTNPVVGDGLGFNLSVRPDDFKAQMDWLDANGYHPIDLTDLRAYLQNERPLPSKPIVLTFDDGYEDMYTAAYPVLKEHHFKAVSYVISGFVGSSHNVSRDQIIEMDHNGIEIAAHTFSHMDLTKLSPDRLRFEIQQSKRDLEDITGHPILDFCYPAGKFNANVVQAAEAAGFQSATTTQGGFVHSFGDRMTWTRVRVSGGESLPAFISSLGPEEPSLNSRDALAYGAPLRMLRTETEKLTLSDGVVEDRRYPAA